ncbi:type III polyketide synthase [Sphingomonas montanisoli]|uniref:Type III polyketide synthase n=1 Tax=Sphingomonas montanisoli TaxID=2606412 RepID=A0A5D9C8X7_9SPHN|nr:type III polyketide synthase [Sphingomonas montanisoli]TZG27602.1 type III polyketide synthase [Sphingomonas montanisoli]
MTAHIHAIGTAIPDRDVHRAFIEWASDKIADSRERALFARMAARSGIEHRWAVHPLAPQAAAAEPTSARMAAYADHAPRLALAAIRDLEGRASIDGVTHLVVASCTGFVAPGIDQIIAANLGLDGSVERTLVGFMGCYAAVAALRVAHHIARSDPAARILVVTVELCSLHLQDTGAVPRLLAMLQFADGAAAALVMAQEGGIALDRFFAATLPDSGPLITWTIGDTGFAMELSGEVPVRIGAALEEPAFRQKLLGDRAVEDIAHWAVHAGGRSILDAVQSALQLPQGALAASRDVLARFGNMSSSTLMFVLAAILAGTGSGSGMALAFGPGLAAEGFDFRLL